MSRFEADPPSPENEAEGGSALGFTGLSEFMGRSAAFGAAGITAGGDLGSGDSLGDVTIVRVLGEGGMGRVYEGVQGSPCRPVAVKVIRPGVLSAAVAKRFEHELHIQGRLTHPGIARIYSAGMGQLPGGAVPYFVMEYVEDALPITAYATRHDLSTRDRVDLFRAACEAVAHGHHKGIIHRDLKPGNILVDGAGHPKIIDFGVARSTAGDVARATMLTDGRQLVGTLQYMSPEQFDPTSDDLDVRVDVYALGVVLYELLAGVPPYEIARRPVYDAARVVKEVEPKSLATVNPKLRGDLQTIVATCLEKERGRRYSSAGELAADLGRYLGGEPIAASRPGLIESVYRLARRHRLAAAAAAAVVAALVAGIVGISIFAVQAERQRALALDARERADAASRETTRQLYVANLRSLQSSLDTRNLHMARRLHAENVRLEEASPPLEMHVLGAGLDDALVVLDLRNGPIIRMGYSPDGGVLAATAIGVQPAQRVVGRAGVLEKVRGGDPAFFAVGRGHEYRRVTECGGAWCTAWRGAVDPTAGFQPTSDDGVVPLAVSPDGTRLAVPARGGGVRILDKVSGRESGVLDATRGHLRKVAFSPDGSRLVMLDRVGDLTLWNAASGELVARCGRRVVHFCFSPEGSRIAGESLPMEPHEVCHDVRVYDVSDGRQRCTARQPQAPGLGKRMLFELGPDGDLLVTCLESGEPHLWDVADDRLLARLQGHAATVTKLAFSPDGGQIAGGAGNGHVRLWNAQTGAVERELLGHDGAISTLVFRPDGETLASGSQDGTVRIWSRTIAEPLAQLPGPRGTTAVAFDPQGALLAVAPPGEGAVELWDARTVERRCILAGPPGTVMQIAFAPDGQTVAAAFDNADQTGEVRVWSTADGAPLATLGPHRLGAVAVAYSPDGSRLLSTSRLATVMLWDPRTGRRLLNCDSPHQSWSDAGAAFGMAGRRVAGTWAHVLDAETGVAAVKLSPRGKVTCVAASPDGRVLATALAIGSVNLEEFATGRKFASLFGHTDSVRAITFSPDGLRVATGSLDGTMRLWDAGDGKEIRCFRGHEAGVEAVLFSPDARRLVTGSSDGTVRIWDVERGQELCVLPGQRDFPKAVALSPDGTRLVTGASAGAVRIWGPSNADVVKARCALAPPP